MEILYIKYNKKYDNEKIDNLFKTFGINVVEIDDPEKIDLEIENLKDKNYTNIIISNELASFSQNIIDKYKYDKKLNIIIAPSEN